MRTTTSFRLGLMCLISLSCLLALPACFTIKKTVVSEYAYENNVKNMLSAMKSQEDRVSSFYSTGTVLIKGWLWGSYADVFVAGVRDPFRIKIEITHPWGNPISYLLIKDGRLDVLDFNEKKIYLGKYTPESLSRFLPGRNYNPDILWSLLRGYPVLPSYIKVRIMKPGSISLLSMAGKVIENIYFPPRKTIPEKVTFPKDSYNMDFEEFQKEGDIHYAARITIKDIMGKRDMLLKREKVYFNRTIPPGVFKMETPSGFEIIHLDER